jgi:hypothetical protein
MIRAKIEEFWLVCYNSVFSGFLPKSWGGGIHTLGSPTFKSVGEHMLYIIDY